MYKFLITTLGLLMLNTAVFAQPGRCPKIPEKYVWESEADYKKDEDVVKKTLKWLCQTPYGIDVEQRGLANAYVLEWLAGSPSIRLEINTAHIQFAESTPDLFFSFIHGMALYKMEHPTAKDELSLYNNGFTVVAELAAQSKEYSKQKELKDLLKAYKKGKVKDYTRAVLNTNEKI
ncbi:MAG: hypothetical protein IPP69_02990 [Flavobacteriales bacterium]|nr:hypothetical protein [Flavobacteriales bacterium]